MASVGASPRGLPHPKELVWRPSSQGRLGCPKSGHGYPKSGHGCSGGVELVLGLHQECPGVVKLVMGLHHVNQHRMLRADLTWMWPMLNWCIVTLASARLKAFMRFPLLRGMYQGGTCKGHDTF